MAENIDTHPVPGEIFDRDVEETCRRLWAEYRSFAADRENEAEEFLDQLKAELEDLAANGDGATSGAIALRRFLVEVTRQESPDTGTSPRGV